MALQATPVGVVFFGRIEGFVSISALGEDTSSYPQYRLAACRSGLLNCHPCRRSSFKVEHHRWRR